MTLMVWQHVLQPNLVLFKTFATCFQLGRNLLWRPLRSSSSLGSQNMPAQPWNMHHMRTQGSVQKCEAQGPLHKRKRPAQPFEASRLKIGSAWPVKVCAKQRKPTQIPQVNACYFKHVQVAHNVHCNPWRCSRHIACNRPCGVLRA